MLRDSLVDGDVSTPITAISHDTLSAIVHIDAHRHSALANFASCLGVLGQIDQHIAKGLVSDDRAVSHSEIIAWVPILAEAGHCRTLELWTDLARSRDNRKAIGKVFNRLVRPGTGARYRNRWNAAAWLSAELALSAPSMTRKMVRHLMKEEPVGANRALLNRGHERRHIWSEINKISKTERGQISAFIRTLSRCRQSPSDTPHSRTQLGGGLTIPPVIRSFPVVTTSRLWIACSSPQISNSIAKAMDIQTHCYVGCGNLDL